MSAELRTAALQLREIRERDGDEALLRVLDQITPADQSLVASVWQLTARPNQLRPANCRGIWLRCAGRMEGKTRSGSEHTLDKIEDWGAGFLGVLCSKTFADVRDVMVEGPSGLMACARRRGYELVYKKNEGRIDTPFGGRMHTLTSEEEDKSRGYEHNYAWLDEIAAWKKPIVNFDNIFAGHRTCGCLMPSSHPMGECPVGNPEMLITTTPRASPIMMRLLKDSTWAPNVTVTRGRSSDNRANVTNLENMESVWGGTKWALQELEGELLESGALLSPEDIARHRVASPLDRERFVMTVLAVDPSIDDKDTSDDCGLCVAALDTDGLVWVLHTEAVHGTPRVWAPRLVELAQEWGVQEIIAERNQGGKGIDEHIDAWATAVGYQVKIEGRKGSRGTPVRGVWATQSKVVRASPCAAKVEQGRVRFWHHHRVLEHELTTWTEGAASPNVLDAWSMAMSRLFWTDDKRPGGRNFGGY